MCGSEKVPYRNESEFICMGKRSKKKTHSILIKRRKKKSPVLNRKGKISLMKCRNSLISCFCLPTAIPCWKYRFSSDHRSQAASGAVSTWEGDHLGTPRVVGIFLFIYFSLSKEFQRHLFFFAFTSVTDRTRREAVSYFFFLGIHTNNNFFFFLQLKKNHELENERI